MFSSFSRGVIPSLSVLTFFSPGSRSHDESCVFTLGQFLRKLKWEDNENTRNYLLKYLNFLSEEPPHLLRCVSTPHSRHGIQTQAQNELEQYTYTVNFANMTEHLRARMVEDFVLREVGFSTVFQGTPLHDVYGESNLEAVCILRILREHQHEYLSVKQISDLAKLLPDDVNKFLYLLYRQGLVVFQEVPLTSLYQIQHGTLFLWKVSREEQEHVLVDRFYFSCMNLLLRYYSELKHVKTFLKPNGMGDRVVSSRPSSSSSSSSFAPALPGGGGVPQMTAANQNHIEQSMRTISRFEIDILRIDSLLTILRDF